MGELMLRRRTFVEVGAVDEGFDIGNPENWVAGTVGGMGDLIIGPGYGQLVTKDVLSDMAGKKIAYEPGYSIYIGYYSNKDGSSAGFSYSGWKTTNPYTISPPAALPFCRILFKPGNDPQLIATAIKPKIVEGNA